MKFISTQLESLIPSELIMPRTNFGKFAVLQEAIQLYNSIPENIKSIDKLCNFKKCIKLYFLCLQNSWKIYSESRNIMEKQTLIL